MRGVALSPVLAVVLILMGIVYTIYVFEQDTNVAKGITKEGEIKKAIIDMDKKLMAIPGIAREVLTYNQFQFKDDDQIERDIETKISQDLGITANVSITGGDWTKTQLKVFIPNYTIKLGDTEVSISNFERDYTIEAPRPHELHRIYQEFNENELCTSFIEDHRDCDCCGVNCSEGEWCRYYRWVDIYSFESSEHNKYNMGRVIFYVIPKTKTYCPSYHPCGGACNCSCNIGEIKYVIRIVDPENVFVDFRLRNRNTMDYVFSCLDPG